MIEQYIREEFNVLCKSFIGKPYTEKNMHEMGKEISNFLIKNYALYGVNIVIIENLGKLEIEFYYD